MDASNLGPAIRERMYARLRRAPSHFAVPAALPVLFFGDICTARIATVGLNPSNKEYLDGNGLELNGTGRRRFETLNSLGATSAASLSDQQCQKAIQTMRQYFRPGKPDYSQWFGRLYRVAQGLGFSYKAGEVAHLDLVQAATSKKWQKLQRAARNELLSTDLPFLQWQLETFPVQAIICNGRTVFDEVNRRLGGEIAVSEPLCRLIWYVGSATIKGRVVGLAGWNLSLAWAGLRAEDEEELGTRLRLHLVRRGVI